MAVVAMLATACGSPGSSASGAGGSRATGAAAYQKNLAYASCVRSHGVPKFPDPQSNGGFAINLNTLGVSQSALQAAENACSYLQAGGGNPTGAQTNEALAQALKFAACMRSHGVPGFPDPTESGRSISFNVPLSLNPQSPAFLTAQHDCQKYRYSGTSGTSGGGILGSGS